MRILYGVVGEGMGHAIRSRVVLDELVQRHDVQVVVSGRAHDYLAKRASDHLQVRKIWGFTIVTEDNEVRNFRTLLENLKGAFTGGWPKNIKAYFDIADNFKPDVVMSDFETWSYLFGVNHRLPVVSVDDLQIINPRQHAPQITRRHAPLQAVQRGRFHRRFAHRPRRGGERRLHADGRGGLPAPPDADRAGRQAVRADRQRALSAEGGLRPARGWAERSAPGRIPR